MNKQEKKINRHINLVNYMKRTEKMMEKNVHVEKFQLEMKTVSQIKHWNLCMWLKRTVESLNIWVFDDEWIKMVVMNGYYNYAHAHTVYTCLCVCAKLNDSFFGTLTPIRITQKEANEHRTYTKLTILSKIILFSSHPFFFSLFCHEIFLIL